MRNLNKKTQSRIHTAVRAGIQIGFFFLIPSAYTAAFGGIKAIFTQIGAGEFINMTPFLAALLLLCGYTVLFGRFFCGYACAFGSLGDWIYALHMGISRLRKKKPKRILSPTTMEILSIAKYLILTAIVLTCFMGIYHKAQGTSPWDVFSQIYAGNLKLDGYLAGGILLALISAGMFVQERFFCRVLCPMGAVFSLLPSLPFFTLSRERAVCIKGCSSCTRNCPSDLELPEKGSLQVKGECFQCGKCIDRCPKENVHCGNVPLKGNEIRFTFLRAAILASFCIWIGV